MRGESPNRADGTDRGILNAIAAAVGDLPLALHLAGSFLDTYRDAISPAQYLSDLHQQTVDHASLQGRGVENSPTEHLLHIGQTFGMSYDRLDPSQPTDALARTLLAHTAHFAPGEVIPRDLLLKTLPDKDESASVSSPTPKPNFLKRLKQRFFADESSSSQPKFLIPNSQFLQSDALRRLSDLGLLTPAENGAVRLHRLLAPYLHAKPEPPTETCQQAVWQVLAEEAYKVNMAGLPNAFLPLRPHLQHAAPHAETAGDERAASLYGNFGYHLNMVGDYAGARATFERAIAIDEAAFGPEHPNVAILLNNIGAVLDDMEKYTEADVKYEQASAIFEANPDREYLAAIVLGNQGVMQVQRGYAGGRAKYEEILRIMKRQFGEHHFHVAVAYNNLATMLYLDEDYNKAREAYERALKIDEAAFSPDHPNVAIRVNNLAYVLEALGQRAEAIALMRRAVAIKLQFLGPEHPSTQNSQRQLAEWEAGAASE